MSISGIIPPQKEELVHNPDGTWDSVHSVAEVEAHGWGDISEKERAKLLQELADNNNTGGPFNIGGYGHWTEKNVNPRAKWTPKERKAMRDFMQLRRKWIAAKIPIIKQELRDKLLNKYGTIHPALYEKLLNVGMQSDARLLIKTKRGIVKTTVSSQHARNASSSEGGKS